MKGGRSAFCIGRSGWEWLPDMDLNHDKQIQSLLCYRYTIGQTNATKLGVSAPESRRLSPNHGISGLLDCWISGLASAVRFPVNALVHQQVRWATWLDRHIGQRSAIPLCNPGNAVHNVTGLFINPLIHLFTHPIRS